MRYTTTASILVQRGIPAVLAMQYEITDRAAIEFSRAFYKALANGLPVDAAVTEARKAVSFAIENTIEWGTPVLYMRSHDGVLFNVQEQKPKDKADRSKQKKQKGRETKEQSFRQEEERGERKGLEKEQRDIELRDKEAKEAQFQPQKAEQLEKERREQEARLAELSALYSKGIEALGAQDWQTAIKHFNDILILDASYSDAGAKLKEAEQQLGLAKTKERQQLEEPEEERLKKQRDEQERIAGEKEKLKEGQRKGKTYNKHEIKKPEEKAIVDVNVGKEGNIGFSFSAVSVPAKIAITIIAIIAIGSAIASTFLPYFQNPTHPAHPTPSLVTSPDSVSLTLGTMHLGDSVSRQITLSNAGGGTLEWNVSADQPWITVNPRSGASLGTVNIDVNTAGLQPGNYSGVITVLSNGGIKSGSISFNLAPLSPSPPILSISNNSFKFETKSTGESKVKILEISNNGGGTLDWRARADSPWIGLNHATGSNNGSIFVTINTTDLSPGSHAGIITIESNGGTGQVAIELNVPPPAPTQTSPTPTATPTPTVTPTPKPTPAPTTPAPTTPAPTTPAPTTPAPTTPAPTTPAPTTPAPTTPAPTTPAPTTPAPTTPAPTTPAPTTPTPTPTVTPTPTLSITASSTAVTAGTPTSVTFTVTSNSTAVSGATVALSGSATGTGTTDASGNTVIGVNAATAGTITATASKTGYADASMTLTASPGLVAPTLLSPPDGSVFSNYPRTTTLKWSPVSGAAYYTVEIQMYSSGEEIQGGLSGWFGYLLTNVTATSYTFDFVGSQPGRWQVWAVDANSNEGPKSGWWGFSYTV